ncbi:MAG: Dolichyl-phosphate-mannose-mannosyltransferase family protein [Candidatus Roizmanbacteria bacterium GW2011_GWA2_35_8]|uniref:Dolichyl-phosphate-mannose-mannosyltransferase family protein n=1 Tax=Candidatus Roizmanbacteria bacterium GW2011_GWA2_35_8 TaxID=1618479 RepID=A0A0G0CV78_9BACT|nr:MAG: Dolichyl-phosphate-mannose-mannosyltransferase family protein [Candidatus Roizmanbacteria bacterium GW2011_GWA2_35_8]
MKKNDFLLLSFILTVALLFRLYRINTPLADLHSWRQVDTAAVARNFVRGGFDLLHPKYDDFSNVQSGFENPQGLRMVEFPLYNAIFASMFKYVPVLPIEVWGRLTSVFFSLIISAIIYYLTLRESGRLAAFFASAIYAAFPFFVFFSRVVLPETTALGFSFLAIFFLYLNPRSLFLCLISLLFFASSMLIKPTVIFFGLPLAYIFYANSPKKFLKNIVFYLFFMLSIIPLFLWRSYIKQFPEGVPVSEWLITSVNTSGSLQRIFFKPAFFRWIFFERINNLILGGFTAGFFVIGSLLKKKRLLLHSILVSSIAFLFVFQGGNVQHEYYQTLILPALAIFSGVGISYFFSLKKDVVYPNVRNFVIIFLILFSWSISFYKVRDYYNFSPDQVASAKIINSLTKINDLVVTDTTGDTTLLYLSDRRGAPSIFKDPETLKELGYDFLVTSSSSEIDILKSENYSIVFENEKMTIFKL